MFKSFPMRVIVLSFPFFFLRRLSLPWSMASTSLRLYVRKIGIERYMQVLKVKIKVSSKIGYYLILKDIYHIC